MLPAASDALREPRRVQTAVLPSPEGGAPTYLTLSADQEPMRLESLCVSCMKNVRRHGGFLDAHSPPPLTRPVLAGPRRARRR